MACAGVAVTGSSTITKYGDRHVRHLFDRRGVMVNQWDNTIKEASDKLHRNEAYNYDINRTINLA